METKNRLEPKQASDVLKELLVFDAYNQKRALVDRLIAMGVTSTNFWQLQADIKGEQVSEGLLIDVANMLSHIEKGYAIKGDSLWAVSLSTINKRVLTWMAKPQKKSS